MHPTSKARRTPYDDSCLDSPWALPCMFRARKKWSVLDHGMLQLQFLPRLSLTAFPTPMTVTCKRDIGKDRRATDTSFSTKSTNFVFVVNNGHR